MGYTSSVGENAQYLITQGSRVLASVLFGSAAWKCRDRDQFIGWSGEARARNLVLLTNNQRFLIMPWVRVPHLGSWILGRVLRRLSADWQAKYGHPILLVETFVERERFRGTVYRAANWAARGRDARADTAGSKHHLARAGERHLRLSAGAQLSGRSSSWPCVRPSRNR